ncbi:MAG: TetR/AcrR family transcriptional regulator, partial [Actinomycetota bacterium]|nr:TetR/AcrR family transcriptional regulator [Actinomycetota bacterium]
MGHREELLAAARRLLEERGYAHITARDLVAASDTNLASIGYHFGSKAALLNAAIEVSFQDWAGQLADFAMSEPGLTPLERAGATWGASLTSMPARRPLLQSYIEALAQAMRVPELRAQL